MLVGEEAVAFCRFSGVSAERACGDQDLNEYVYHIGLVPCGLLRAGADAGAGDLQPVNAEAVEALEREHTAGMDRDGLMVQAERVRELGAVLVAQPKLFTMDLSQSCWACTGRPPRARLAR